MGLVRPAGPVRHGPDIRSDIRDGAFSRGYAAGAGTIGRRRRGPDLESAGVPALWAKSRQSLQCSWTSYETDLSRSARLWPLRGIRAGGGAHVSVAHPLAWPWCKALIDRRMVIADFRPPDVIRLGPAPLYTRFVDVFDAAQKMTEVLEAGVEEVQGRPRVT